MEWNTYELISNIGDDLKAMAERTDKRLMFSRGGDNAQRHAAFDALREAGVVTIDDTDPHVVVTLVI